MLVQMIHREYHNVYSEVDGLSTLLSYKTSNAGCCKARAAALERSSAPCKQKYSCSTGHGAAAPGVTATDVAVSCVCAGPFASGVGHIGVSSQPLCESASGDGAGSDSPCCSSQWSEACSRLRLLRISQTTAPRSQSTI